MYATTTAHPAATRHLTDAQRKQIFRTLWARVMENDHGSGSQPVAIFGGDFNCKPLQWVQCLKHAMDTQASRRSVQTCTSARIPRHHGDRAVVFNAFAAQEHSGWGKTTSELTSRCRSRMTMTSCLFPFVGDDAYSSQPAVLHGLLSHRWLLLLVQMQCRITQHKSLIMQKAAHLLRSRYLPRHSSPYHRCLLKHKQAAVLHDLLRRHLRLTLPRNRRSTSQAHQGTKNRRRMFHSR